MRGIDIDKSVPQLHLDLVGSVRLAGGSPLLRRALGAVAVQDQYFLVEFFDFLFPVFTGLFPGFAGRVGKDIGLAHNLRLALDHLLAHRGSVAGRLGMAGEIKEKAETKKNDE